MITTERAALFARVAAALDGLPDRVVDGYPSPVFPVWGSTAELLEDPYSTTDDAALVGLGEIIEGLCDEYADTWEALTTASVSGSSLWDDPEWLAIVRHYRACQSDVEPRPSQLTVAVKMGVSEQTIRERLRPHGIKRWTVVHALIAARGVSIG